MTHFHLLHTAQQMAGAQDYPKGTLYLVPTPIGNLADITLRALHVLSLADAIACEDTRHARHLLNQYDITSKHLFALHQHNEHEASLELLQRLEQGQRVALITDAGTPAISDPGAKAVQAVQQAGFRTMPLPGANSVTTAMSAAGLLQGHTLFYGFLPTKAQERQSELKTLLAQPHAVVLLEAPHRIVALIADLAGLAPERSVTLARELTKQFEQIKTLPAVELELWLKSRNEHSKGEFVCVIHAPEQLDLHDDVTSYDQALEEALQYMPTKVAANFIAGLSGISKNTLYQRALHLKQKK